jgi:hypothetical protein
VHKCFYYILTYILMYICLGVISLGCMVSFIFSFLRSLHTAFHSGCTDLHSYQQCVSVPFTPLPHQHLLFVFLIKDILSGVRWNPNVVLICAAIRTKDVEYFSCIYCPFVLLLLRIVHSVYFLIDSMGYWLFAGLVFWAPCIW